jgi:acrylyl-CoA reductase (NADPH)
MVFRALVIDHDPADRRVTATIRDLDEGVLPNGDVRVRVQYSTVNFKDALVLGGLGRLVRAYPHVPGIDLAGVVESSMDPRFSPGDEVVLTGWRVGETWWGGYAELAQVRGDWLLPIPEQLSARDCMIIGTAGLTAALALSALEANGLTPDDGAVLVTGATGGLGSTAVHLLARRGYRVTASTGKPKEARHLALLGASDVIDRAQLSSAPDRPLLPERWAGCIDAVGGSTVAHVLAELRYGAAVAMCGNTGGNDVPTNTLPFLLRGVRALGIDSVQAKVSERQRAWSTLATLADMDVLSGQIREIGLEEIPAVAADLLAGRIAGRVIVVV